MTVSSWWKSRREILASIAKPKATRAKVKKGKARKVVKMKKAIKTRKVIKMKKATKSTTKATKAKKKSR